MEKGFILPNGQYVQAIEAAHLSAADYPAGTVEVPLRPSAHHHWEGGAWVYRAPPYAPRDLTPAQFEYLLALTGFGAVWDAIAGDAAAGGDMVTYAALMAERKRSRFRLDTVLSVVAQFADQAAAIAPEVNLSETAIRAAWKKAEEYGGLGDG